MRMIYSYFNLRCRIKASSVRGMDRLELILGFRGCRREMDMEAENTIVWTRHC